VPDDPYADPVTGVLRNKLGLGPAQELAVAEREITHAALILLRESPVRATYDLPHLGFAGSWQHLDATRCARRDGEEMWTWMNQASDE
jgi:hypothetical protein